MIRHCVTALLTGLVPAAPALAGLSHILVDYAPYDGLRPRADGVLDPDEYGYGNAQWVPGSGRHNGLGGAVGSAGARLYFAQGPAGFHFGFRPGARLQGTVILFVDSAVGGRTAGSGPGIVPLSDDTDPARRAMSQLRGGYPAEPGLEYTFDADVAITFNADGVGVWRVPGHGDPAFTQVGGYAQHPSGGDLPFFEAVVPDTGGFGGVSFFAAYVSDGGLLSDECFPVQPFADLGNPGVQTTAAAPVDFSDYALVTSFIPSPTAAAPLGLAALLAMRRRRY